MLQDRSLARRGIKACQDTQQRLMAQTEPPAEVLDEWRAL